MGNVADGNRFLNHASVLGVGIESMPFSNLRMLGTDSLFHAQAHRTCPGTALVNIADGAEPSGILDAERLGPACRPGQTGNLSEG